MQQREGILASGDDDLPIDEAELAPLQSNGNGEVRALDNGHAVQFPVNPEDTLRDFNNSQISPRAHNMWERLRKILEIDYLRATLLRQPQPLLRPQPLLSKHKNSF